MKVTKAYFMLMVRDMDQAVAFYRGTFGLKVRYQSPEWTEMAWGDAVVALHRGNPSGSLGLGFEVDDLEAACQAVAAAGGQVVGRPQDRPAEGIQLATVADPMAIAFR
jgi:predicted enzyme related to lactoylglutathione lyase